MKALIVVDMQKVYFKDEAMVRQLLKLVHSNNELIQTFKNKDNPVFLIKTEHQKDGSSWTLNMFEDNKGLAFTGSHEAEFVDGLVTEDCVKIIKTRDSSFHNTNLLDSLKQYSVSELVITGILAHTCVFHTAVDAYAYNYPVTLVSGAIGDQSYEMKQHAFDYLQNEYRQELV